MPELEWNKKYWDGGYDWKGRGEEWSEAWGGSEAQWFGSLYPRIHRFLPAKSILEIAMGYGRWTNYLLPHASDRFIGVDMSQECVNYCSNAFSNAPKAVFYGNDGLSLDCVADNSIDFVFCFDSLVHAEIDVVEHYIQEILGKLTPNGVAFIHHSNWAAIKPDRKNNHMRAESVSGLLVEKAIARHGGSLLIQEVLTWGRFEMIDAISTFRRHRPQTTPTRLVNPRFMEEAENLRSVHSAYCEKTL